MSPSLGANQSCTGLLKGNPLSDTNATWLFVSIFERGMSDGTPATVPGIHGIHEVRWSEAPDRNSLASALRPDQVDLTSFSRVLLLSLTSSIRWIQSVPSYLAQGEYKIGSTQRPTRLRRSSMFPSLHSPVQIRLLELLDLNVKGPLGRSVPTARSQQIWSLASSPQLTRYPPLSPTIGPCLERSLPAAARTVLLRGVDARGTFHLVLGAAGTDCFASTWKVFQLAAANPRRGHDAMLGKKNLVCL